MKPEYREVLKQILASVKPGDSREVISNLSELRKMTHQKDTPNWFLLYLKATAKAYNVPGMEDFECPREIDGVRIFYALNMKEVEEIVDIKEPAFYNKYYVGDQAHLLVARADYDKQHPGKSDPEYAVIYKRYLWFVDPDLVKNLEVILAKLEVARETATVEPQPANEISENENSGLTTE